VIMDTWRGFLAYGVLLLASRRPLEYRSSSPAQNVRLN
jgi:hypothetical protein